MPDSHQAGQACAQLTGAAALQQHLCPLKRAAGSGKYDFSEWCIVPPRMMTMLTKASQVYLSPSRKLETMGIMTNCREPRPDSTIWAAKRIAANRSRLPTPNTPHPRVIQRREPSLCTRHLPSVLRLQEHCCLDTAVQCLHRQACCCLLLLKSTSSIWAQVGLWPMS